MLCLTELAGFGVKYRKIYDPDAQAYITATGELFPDALNDLVLALKAAGVWSKLDSFKKAIGVPSLAASMIDLRNTTFNATAVNNPGHSATTGWTFLQASSQYVDNPWGPGISGATATVGSVHFARRIKSALASGGSAIRSPGNINASCGFEFFEPGFTIIKLNDNTNLTTGDLNVTGHYIGSRVGTARALYRNGSALVTDTQATGSMSNRKMPIGARNNAGTIDGFFTGRITVEHSGQGLDATEAAAATAAVDAYATAAGEA